MSSQTSSARHATPNEPVTRQFVQGFDPPFPCRLIKKPHNAKQCGFFRAWLFVSDDSIAHRPRRLSAIDTSVMSPPDARIETDCLSPRVASDRRRPATNRSTLQRDSTGCRHGGMSAAITFRRQDHGT